MELNSSVEIVRDGRADVDGCVGPAGAAVIAVHGQVVVAGTINESLAERPVDLEPAPKRACRGRIHIASATARIAAGAIGGHRRGPAGSVFAGHRKARG